MVERWLLVVLIVVFAVMLFVSSLTGYSFFFALGNEGGQVRYSLFDVRDFVQCFDADPQNLPTVKSVCHAQYYVNDQARLLGMNSVDYCVSSMEVVDYYCAPDFSCRERVTSCEKGFACNDGQCVKQKGILRLPRLLSFSP